MDILFSCYRAACEPNDKYLIEEALNTDDTPGDTTLLSPVHAMALYAKQVAGSPDKLRVPVDQLQSFDDHAASCIADLVIARAGDADPAVFFNVIRQRDEDDSMHRIAFDTAVNTCITTTTQPVESYLYSPYQELISDQQNTDRPWEYVANPASRYFDISVVLFRHDGTYPAAEVEHPLEGFVPVSWAGESWFTPLNHVGYDFFDSAASAAPEAICSAVRVSDQYSETLSVVSIL